MTMQAQYVYIGPFAEWVVTPDIDNREGNIYTLIDNALMSTGGYGFDVEVDGVPHIQRCFIPNKERPGQPRRTMFILNDCEAAEDWTSVSHEKEIAWFITKFKKELKALAKHYGKQPTIRWGLVAWDW
jgi:hypothetical protein